jgi:hypothetical protein
MLMTGPRTQETRKRQLATATGRENKFKKEKEGRGRRMEVIFLVIYLKSKLHTRYILEFKMRFG